MKALRFRLSERARLDLEEIWLGTCEQSGSVDVAHKVVQSIYDALTLLGDSPGAGHARQDLTSEPLRFWSVYSYLIIYRYVGDPVEIARVLHGARYVATLLAEDG